MRRINGPCFERTGEVRAPNKGDVFETSYGTAAIASHNPGVQCPILHPVTEPVYAIDPTDVHFEQCGRDEATHWLSKNGNIVRVHIGDLDPSAELYFRRWLRLVTVEVAETPEQQQESKVQHKLTIALTTEQSMHAAWRKRAEESEAAFTALSEVSSNRLKTLEQYRQDRLDAMYALAEAYKWIERNPEFTSEYEEVRAVKQKSRELLQRLGHPDFTAETPEDKRERAIEAAWKAHCEHRCLDLSHIEAAKKESFVAGYEAAMREGSE